MGCLLVHPAFGQQRLVDMACTPAHLEAAGQDAVARKATVDAIVHHPPDPRNPVVQCGAVTVYQFIGAFHRSDADAAGFGHRQHFIGTFKRVRNGGAAGPGFAARLFRRCHHKTATDREIGFFGNHIALFIGGAHHHAVGMPLQRRAIVELQIARRVKQQIRQAGVDQPVSVPDRRQRHLCLCSVIGFGQEPGQTQDHRAVGGVADAGKGEGAMQRRPDPTGMKRRCPQQVEKPPRRHHRPHRMRRRRANPDLEHVEHAEKHRSSGAVVRSD